MFIMFRIGLYVTVSLYSPSLSLLWHGMLKTGKWYTLYLLTNSSDRAKTYTQILILVIKPPPFFIPIQQIILNFKNKWNIFVPLRLSPFTNKRWGDVYLARKRLCFVYIIQTESLMLYNFIILFSLHTYCIRVKIGFVTNTCHLQ